MYVRLTSKKMIWSLLGTIAKGAVDVVKTKTETKKLLAKAEQTHAMKMAEGKIDFEIAAQNNMKDSWRDEWFTILLSIPLVIVFISIFFNITKKIRRSWYLPIYRVSIFG
mgnify:CR=1 FL=1